MKLHLSNGLLFAGLLIAAAFGPLGCTTEQPESDDTDTEVELSEGDESSEVVGEAEDAIQTCVTIKRGGTGNVFDAWLAGDYPSYAAGAEINMYTGVSDGGNVNRIAVNFDLSVIPQYATINSATFNIYKSWSADNATINVYRGTSSWNEATVKAGSSPTFDPVAVGSFSGSGVGFKTVNVKNVVQGWKNGAAQNGLVIDESPIEKHNYFSSESGLAPSLDVCFTIASCVDGIQNQGENGVDCGGPCPSCVSCSDGVQNQGETGVDCGGPCAACPYVQITGAGEAYGHHGACSGWNLCGTAGTCALWACYAKGYSKLTSYGASGPCTGFSVCHLFNSPCGGPGQCNIQYNWGNWCAVAGVTDIKCHN